MITSLLGYGKENARTASELAQLTGLTPREVTRLIEQARRQGEPICASNDSACPGYFLTNSPETLDQYVGSLGRRIRNMNDGRDALIRTRDRMTGQLRLCKEDEPEDEPES